MLDIVLGIILEICIYYELSKLLGKKGTQSSAVVSSLSGVAWSSQIVGCRKFEAREENTWLFLLNGIFEL